MYCYHKKRIPPAQMTIKDLLRYVRDLEAENARLEESFQKATGEIAADPLPKAVEKDLLIKVSKECQKRTSWEACSECPYTDKYDNHNCIFLQHPRSWEGILAKMDGGMNNE